MGIKLDKAILGINHKSKSDILEAKFQEAIEVAVVDTDLSLGKNALNALHTAVVSGLKCLVKASSLNITPLQL